jgi:hypothetical protein
MCWARASRSREGPWRSGMTCKSALWVRESLAYAGVEMCTFDCTREEKSSASIGETVSNDLKALLHSTCTTCVHQTSVKQQCSLNTQVVVFQCPYAFVCCSELRRTNLTNG